MKLLLLAALLAPLGVLAQTRADLQCKATGTDLIFDCTIRLARGDQPLEGAQVSVGADMPSMPMAHNVKPVKARPGHGPGEYLARLDLEMPGEWAVKVRVSGKVRDQVVLHYQFDERGARPVRKRK